MTDAVNIPHRLEMDLKSELLREAAAYCDTAKISKARLATLVANDGKVFDRIEGGGGLTLKMYERFLAYFKDHPAADRHSANKPVSPSKEAA